MILITGAPKNGLSVLAKYFIQLGMTTAPDFTTNPDPVHRAVASINNDILRSSGCAWNHAPNGTLFKATGAINYRISHFLNQNEDIDFLVDPRFAFTWQLWEKVLQDVDLLVTFRKPGEAALSFRDEFGGFACEAITVWSQHYTRLASVNGAFVEFGADIDFFDYDENVGRAMRFLELDHQTTVLERCFDESKITHNQSTSIFPIIKKLYTVLQSKKEN
jgi:hypothetical protein